MRAMLCAVLVLCILCNVPKTCEGYTEDRTLGNFGEVLAHDLGGLVRGEGLLDGWVRIVEYGEPIAWTLLLVGGPIALQVLPRKTLRQWIRPAPMFPPSVANPADAAKLKALLKRIDKQAALLGRIKGLFGR